MLLSELGLTAVVALSAGLVDLPGLIGYRVEELRLGGKEVKQLR